MHLKKILISNKQGAMFVLVVGMVMVLLVAGILFVTLLTTDTKIAANNRDSSVAFYAAEAGVEKAMVNIEADPNLRTTQTGTLNGGTFTATFTNQPDGNIFLKSVGQYRGIQRTITLILTLGSWPMFHFDAPRTGFASQTILNPFTSLWNYNTGSVVNSSPIVYGGVVYFGADNGYLYRINANTGSYLGRFRTNGAIVGTPAAADGVIYVGSADTYFYAIDTATGNLLWSKSDPLNPSPIRSSPVVVNGIVYYGADNGKIYALDAVTGTLMPGWPYTAGGAIVCAPAVSKGVVYFGALDGKVYAVDAVTGQLKSGWPYTTMGPVYSSPSVDETQDTIYIGSDDTYLYEFDTTGAKVGSFKTGGRIRSSPAIRSSGSTMIFVGSDDNRIYALQWTQRNWGWWHRNRYWVLDDLWNQNVGGDVRSSPSLCGNYVFVGSGDTDLYVFDIVRGRQRYRYNSAGAIQTSPALFGDNVYFTCSTRLYAVSGKKALPGPVHKVNYSWKDVY
jgi:eukaryotic-like serine/threonine-protein kinase